MDCPAVLGVSSKCSFLFLSLPFLWRGFEIGRPTDFANRLVWHQTLRSILSSNCDFVLLSLLRLPRQSLLTRHARLAASFALSGVLHHVVDALVGVPLQESGMFKFMSIQWIGIVIEDFVRFVWRKMGGRLPGCTARTLGYAWLCLWLVWTSPGVFYPYSRIADGTRQEHGMLPFTLKDS